MNTTSLSLFSAVTSIIKSERLPLIIVYLLAFMPKMGMPRLPP